MLKFIFVFCSFFLVAHFSNNRISNNCSVTRYTVADLGVLQNHQSSRAFGVSNHGIVVGESTQNFLTQNAFMCKKSGAMQEVMNFFGAGQCVAVAVSNAGHITGYYCDKNGVSHGWLLYGEDNGNKIRNLGTLGGNFCIPYDVNSSGVVVGCSFNSDYKNHAFVWSDGVMTDLFPTSDFAFATGINDAGESVGFFVNESFESIAFLRRVNGEVINLGSLGHVGLAFSNANGLNNLGQVVGKSSTKSGYSHAFIFTDGEMRDLGTLRKANGASDTTSEAFKINNHGVVIGDSVSLGVPARPFVWSEKNGMQDLQKLLQNDITDFSAFSAKTFHLERVSDINDAGEIVGWGYWGGSSYSHAVLLTPIS
ncbi:hypothetical protein EXS61_00760 [Candidatus Parcubacteria bacterium]|nr:hypothetical protein [Candidatus Parcubacteria bacterium]